ncbi:hypothetical protein [Actinomadura chokoriensis]|uniref:hypothetical protein n=1 Tax=Actinomadura chokoriensis TaxID=454156 RepID=UPI0031F95B3F
MMGLNWRHRRAAEGSPPEQRGGHGGRVSLTWLLQGQQAGLRDDNLTAVPALVQLINEPERSRTRTVESISLQGRVIGQRVTMEFQLPPVHQATSREESGSSRSETASPSGEIYVPIMMVRKPELIDNLSITDAQGQTVTRLSFEETARLIAVTLRFLVLSCGVSLSGSSTARRPAQPENMWLAEAQLLELIHAVGDPGDVDPDIDKAFELLDLPTDGEVSDRQIWLREFVRALSHAYPLIVALPEHAQADRIVITYQRTLIPTLNIDGIRGRLRLALGLRPFKVSIDTALARLSKSYHLQVQGPASQYLMEQTLRCRVCQLPLTRDGVRTTASSSPQCRHREFPARGRRPYFELRGKRGQSYAHLYMRGFAEHGKEDFILAASFGETPPGTLASAAITAAVSCLFIGAVGHAQAVGITPGSDIPPLLLALPAAAASWFGFHSDGEAVLRSSLAARVSLFISGINSLLAATVFLVTKRPDKAVQSFMPPHLFGMHLPSWWSVLLVAAFVNLLAISAQLMVRSWSYRRLLLRKENDGTQTGHRVAYVD